MLEKHLTNPAYADLAVNGNIFKISAKLATSATILTLVAKWLGLTESCHDCFKKRLRDTVFLNRVG